MMTENNHTELVDIITKKIRQHPQQRITFADYMNEVLYHPQHGYYVTRQAKIGKDGDFITSPRLCADFGEMLAEQFMEMWQVVGTPAHFTLVEIGAGQAILANDILTYLQNKFPDFYKNLHYLIVEKSPAFKEEQKRRLESKFSVVQWCEIEEIPPNSIIGCYFSNELFDAFPVHQFMIKDGQILEIYVSLNSQSKELDNLFKETIDEVSTPKILEYFQELNLNILNYPNGYRSEVNLQALEWIKIIANQLKRGYILTIDYGYPSHRYYHPQRREGTLQCYYHHRYHSCPYINIGHQDITAHVNFTALEKQGELVGLEKLSSTQQALFLMALGLGERLAILSSDQANSWDLITLLNRRDALHQLIDPMGLGGFTVFLQGKGLQESEKQPLKGFIIP